MNKGKPLAILAPPVLVLSFMAPLMWRDLFGLESVLGGRLFAFWESLSQGSSLRPPMALPAEIFLLLVAGSLVILLLQRRPTYEAGFFTALALAAAFETSWFLFLTRRWLIDAATPGFGIFLVFLAGALAAGARSHRLRARLGMAFSGFLSPAMIKKIALRPEILSLEGEIRTVTYLVCGLNGLGARASEHRGDPKTFMRLMNAVLAPLLEEAGTHGGIIDRLTPDGFTAFWNAPLEDPDHALHACEAAERIAAMAAQLNAELALARAPDGKAIAPLEINIGIATGEVIAGGLGAPGRFRYGVHGEAVALAAHLQALSSQYGSAAIVSEETRRAAEQAFAFLEVDCIAAEHDDTPVRLYALEGRTRVSPKFRALSTFHEHIFNALRGQQWTKARDLIGQCRKLSGASQTLYELYLARIKYLERNPPGANWDGAFRPVVK